jgi:hypothetical protein
MSLINEYRATEEALKELQERLHKMAGDDRLKKEIEFEKKLRDLMAEYGKNLSHIISIIDPKTSAKAVVPGATKARRARVAKRYVNPHTKQEVVTKGGNHGTLKAWKAQYGADVVEGWVA